MGKKKVFINIKPGGRTTSHSHGNDGPQQWLKRKEPKLALKRFTIDVEPDLPRRAKTHCDDLNVNMADWMRALAEPELTEKRLR